jgi:hypothetical protein
VQRREEGKKGFDFGGALAGTGVDASPGASVEYGDAGIGLSKSIGAGAVR